MTKYLTILLILLFFSANNASAFSSDDSVLVKKITASLDLHEIFLQDGKSVLILLEYSRTKLGDTLIVKNKLEDNKIALLKESLQRCVEEIRKYYNGDLLLVPIVFVNANHNLLTATFDNFFTFFEVANLYHDTKINFLKTIVISGYGPRFKK